MTTWTRFGVLSAILAITLAGCGDDGDRSPQGDGGANPGGLFDALGGGGGGQLDPGTIRELQNNLKMVGIAFHNVHATYNEFPPGAAYKNANGEPVLSWRVALLPYLEQAGLYERFALDEAWDSPQNEPLLGQMPAIFRSPGVTKPGYTTLVALDAPTALLYAPVKPRASNNYFLGPQLRDITDGTANTILAIYGPPESAVPWTAPQDLAFDPQNPLAAFGNSPPEYVLALFADGSVHRLRAESLAPENFRRMVEYRDGQPVQF